MFSAPEIFTTAQDDCKGYSYAVDWWSLGIVIYEMLRGKVRESVNVYFPLPSLLSPLSKTCSGVVLKMLGHACVCPHTN